MIKILDEREQIFFENWSKRVALKLKEMGAECKDIPDIAFTINKNGTASLFLEYKETRFEFVVTKWAYA